MSQRNEKIWTEKETATRKISEERNIWNSFFATVKLNQKNKIPLTQIGWKISEVYVVQCLKEIKFDDINWLKKMINEMLR